MIILTGTEKVFHKIQHTCMIKNSQQSGCKVNMPQYNKGHI